jgi:hypothetical protein
MVTKAEAIDHVEDLAAVCEAQKTQIDRLRGALQTSLIAMTIAHEMPAVAAEYDFTDAKAVAAAALTAQH